MLIIVLSLLLHIHRVKQASDTACLACTTMLPFRLRNASAGVMGFAGVGRGRGSMWEMREWTRLRMAECTDRFSIARLIETKGKSE